MPGWTMLNGRKASRPAGFSWALLVLAIVLTSLAAPSTAASGDNARTIYYLLPAVEGESDSRGRLIEATLSVKPSPGGGFKVVAGGEVDPTTELSMKMAALNALLLAGVSWRSVEVSISIRSQGPVAGPSGSLATAVAVVMAAAGYDDVSVHGNYGYVITGAITPGGLAAKVGGIPAKCAAANREGYVLALPLSNKADAPPGCSYAAVAGVLDALSLMGWPRPAFSYRGGLPEAFNESMLGIAEDMRSNALNALEDARGRIPRDDYSRESEAIKGLIEKSVEAERSSPYAAASLAFTALTRAYTLSYLASLQEGLKPGEALAELESELESLRAELDGMEKEGSMLYIEMLAVAYTRLADAEASIESLKTSPPGEPSSAAAQLGYIKARLESVEGWLKTAGAVKDIGRELRSEDLRIIYSVFREYGYTSADYGRSLVEYMINAYNLPEGRFAPYLAAISKLVSEARMYEERGNYVAAIGFLRDAVSMTLQVVSAAPEEAPQPEDLELYRREMEAIISVLLARASSLGFQSGLTEAYIQYAEVLAGDDPQLAIAMMEEATASAILWSIAAEAMESQLEAPAQPAPTGQDTLAQRIETGAVVVSALAAAGLLFTLGVYITARSFARSYRIW
ncbi:hypothetical protein [Aeropyrum pernix]|uniref:hypothetical protein n=1 Tax=Aeropyrum pernix TaxID=56636 RepID=UPI001037D677|nr:hypothetical protein [Aeropyrum pernix]